MVLAHDAGAMEIERRDDADQQTEDQKTESPKLAVVPNASTIGMLPITRQTRRTRSDAEEIA
jgi:hypothetical protein